MLVLGRTTNPDNEQNGDIILRFRDVEVTIRLCEIRSKTWARIGIIAPEEVQIIRGELLNNKTEEGRDVKDPT